jgi:hypothetical protein
MKYKEYSVLYCSLKSRGLTASSWLWLFKNASQAKLKPP